MVQPQQTHRPPLRSVLEAHVTVTAATYTAKAGDRVIGVNHTGAVTLTFPTAQLRSGRTYTVKDESGAAATNNITVATEGPETIDGSATDTISENYGSKTYYSDGSNWFTVPLLAVGSHTLASHSAKAHSDLTSIGAGDHHAAGSDISVRAYHSLSQSIPDATATAQNLDSERFDTDGIHDTSTNNERLTAQTAGKYFIAGQILWSSNSTGQRRVKIIKNGSTTLAQIQQLANSGGGHTQFIATLEDMAVGDYVHLEVFQDSGGALNSAETNPIWPHFMMFKVLG